MRSNRSAILVMGALLGVPAALAGQMCFRARPAPRCHSFWITEAGASARLDAHQPPELGGSVTFEVGHMFNIGTRSSLGAGVFVQSPEPILGFGLRPRYRQWLSPTVSLDIAPGIEYRSSEARFYPSGQLALNLGSGFALTGDVHQVHHLYEVNGPKHLAWFAGARLGGGFGILGILGMAALTGLVAASWH